MREDQFDSTTEVRERGSMRGATVFFLITTIVFLGAGIYLFASNNHKNNEAKSLSTELTTSENRYTDLDAKYTSALAEIESYKGKNAEMDSILTVKEKYIKNLQSNLNKEKKNRTLSDAEYKRQLADLNNSITDLNAKMDALQKENTTLKSRTDSLGNDITQKTSHITELETSNTTLTKKVTVASLLVPSDIEVTGLKTKSNGKEDETMRANKATQLQVCFNVPENKVSDPGSKSFMIRVLDPSGKMIATDGAGTFTGVETGEQLDYTSTATIDYQNAAQNGICTKMKPSQPLAEGKYTTEIYQDGYLIGKSSFEMK